MMYPANKSSQENSAWEKAINNVLSPSSSSKPASTVPQVQSLQKLNGGGGSNNNNNARQDDKFRFVKALFLVLVEFSHFILVFFAALVREPSVMTVLLVV